jgi:hypothetical protein
MGKRAKRIIEKIPTKKKKIKRYFFKNLLSILPLVILLVVSVNIFIFYYIPSMDGLIFLYNLFGSGDFVVPSMCGVVIFLVFQLLIIRDADGRTKTVLGVYFSMLGLTFVAAPSIGYNKLLGNELNWTFFLITDCVLEIAAIYFIYLAIKNFSKKHLVRD